MYQHENFWQNLDKEAKGALIGCFVVFCVAFLYLMIRTGRWNTLATAALVYMIVCILAVTAFIIYVKWKAKKEHS